MRSSAQICEHCLHRGQEQQSQEHSCYFWCGNIRAVASGGGSGARPPHLKTVPPHLTFGPPVAANIQYCILKMWFPLLVFGPSFWFLTPPATKSWRRAWETWNACFYVEVLNWSSERRLHWRPHLTPCCTYSLLYLCLKSTVYFTCCWKVVSNKNSLFSLPKWKDLTQSLSHMPSPIRNHLISVSVLPQYIPKITISGAGCKTKLQREPNLLLQTNLSWDSTECRGNSESVMSKVLKTVPGGREQSELESQKTIA